ncbi:hypothetical protein MPSEU_000306600 [Mayamaea pseudoterrestris]|nr:hypothetical protein MPSEU_000306600 [Mayamaea pseudoterrestris]
MTSPRRPAEHRMQRRRRSWFMSSILLLVTFLQVLRHRASSDEQFMESRHPLGTRRMRAIPQTNIEKDLRYITFGSSITWGVGLDDFKQAYPYRLSSKVRNAASRMGGAALAAACTETIVGEDLFDVVTIEFVEFDETHVILSKRLRRRFPNAVILFVRLWHPENIRYTSDFGDIIDLNTWRTVNGGHSIYSSELALLMMEAGPAKWHIQIPDDPLLKNTVEHIGARVVILPMPDQEAYAFPQNLLSFLTFFDENEHHLLTARGHAALALEILSAVKSVSSLGTRLDGTVGSWGSGDQCNMWYYNGQFLTSSGQKLKFSQDGDGSHKHALEFMPGGGAWIRVTNKFESDRMLHLTYMTASDEEDNKVYPRTRVRVNNRAFVVLEPYNEGTDDAHLTRTSVVGRIPPGESVIYMDPLETSQLYFRLVGASLLSEEAIEGILPIDFKLEPEPAAAF